MNEKIDALMQFITTSRNIVAILGSDLYEKRYLYHDPAKMIKTPLFNLNNFKEDPKQFYESYLEVFKENESITSCSIYDFLQKLQNRKILKGIITQKIDGTESDFFENVLYLHGNYRKFECLDNVHHKVALDERIQKEILSQKVPLCQEDATPLKPAVQFLGQAIFDLEKAITLIQEVDLILLAGVNLEFYPLFRLMEYVEKDIPFILFNTQDSSLNHKAKIVFKEENLENIFSKLPL